MNRNRVKTFLRAALLASVAFSIPVNAGEPADFDQGRSDVSGILDAGREAAAAQPDGKGVSVKTKTPAATEDGIERRIVIFKKGTSSRRRLAIVTGAGASVTKDLWLINGAAIVLPSGKAKSVEAGLASNSEVKRIEKDFVQNWLEVSATACPPGWPPGWPCPIPDDPDDGAQTVPWGIKRVNASAAWPTTRGKGVKVVVIDTGIDFSHPELTVEGGYNSVDPETSYKDDHGHGTHVSGTIAAADNDKGVVGVAPDVTLYGVKVLDAQGRGTYATVIGGIQWAVENKMDVANMSLGGDESSDAMADAVEAAAKAGVTIVAAAGNNSGAVGYPASYPGTIAISASTSNDGLAYFSSRGPAVEFIAPGAGINSTFKGGGYRKLDGTSMASPHVAGLAALAVAQGAHGIEAIRKALKAAATKLPSLGGEKQGSGMIDAGVIVQ